MKKQVSILVAIFFLFTFIFQINTHAFEADINSGDYLADTTITINLKAKPVGEENAVSINLAAEGMTILNYTPPVEGDWIGPTSDCDNNQVYSTNRVCTSMAKAEPITEGESLGTITVEINGSTYAKLTKTAQNAYSDGNGIRNDEGVLVEFNKSFKVETADSNSSSQNINLSFITNTQPLILAVALVVIVLLVVLMLWPKIKNTLKKPEPTSSSPF